MAKERCRKSPRLLLLLLLFLVLAEDSRACRRNIEVEGRENSAITDGETEKQRTNAMDGMKYDTARTEIERGVEEWHKREREWMLKARRVKEMNARKNKGINENHEEMYMKQREELNEGEADGMKEGHKEETNEKQWEEETKGEWRRVRDTIRCRNITDAENGDHPAPVFLQTLQGSFTCVMEMTLMNQNKTYYVEETKEVREVQGEVVDTGAVRVKGAGVNSTYYYYPSSRVVVEELNGQCHALSGTDPPTFNPWGWWDPNPMEGQMIFGPSAILRQAYFTNKRFLGSEKFVSGVNTEYWQTCVEGGTINVFYYFSERGWEMPLSHQFYEGDGRLPVRMEVLFFDTLERVQYNILSFTPFLLNPTLAETPRGESCEGLVSVVPEATPPTLPTHFSLYQEVVRDSMIDGNDLGRYSQRSSKVKLTYSQAISLIRYDFTPLTNEAPFYTTSPLRVIHDYNTGVAYVIDAIKGNCTKERISQNLFDNGYGGMLSTGGMMVSPNELFHFDDTFSLVGQREERAQVSWLWTATRSDIPDPTTNGMQTYPKAVLEYYFVETLEGIWGEVLSIMAPVRADLFVYNNSDPMQVMRMVTTNIYSFTVLGMETEDEYVVSECYDDDDTQWSYFFLVFPADEKQMEAVALNEDYFRSNLFLNLMETCLISPTRIASIDVSVGLAGPSPFQSTSTSTSSSSVSAANAVLTNVKVLVKAPYIFSYEEPWDGPNPVPGDKQVRVEGVETPEHCATLCSTYDAFSCRAFHHCGKTCFLSRVEGTDGHPNTSMNGCHLWVLSVPNATLPDPPTDQAFSTLFDTIHMHQFSVVVPYEDTLVRLYASDGFHYKTLHLEDVIARQFSLAARYSALRYPNDTLHKMNSLEGCMEVCAGFRGYRCVMLSYSPAKAECRLSSIHFDESGNSALMPETGADVYSRSYLVDYAPVLGGVSLNTSGPVHTDVDNVETCARYCSLETKIVCQSFEYCPLEHVCRLHAEHFLDVADGGNYATDTDCIHYSTRTDADFSQYTSQSLPSSKHALIADFADSSSCAKLCLDKTGKVCESFDLCRQCGDVDAEACGDVGVARDLCFLSTHHLGEPGVTLVTAPHCTHFSRNSFGDLDYASWVNAKREQQGYIYTAGDMAWLGIAMVLLGVFLTAGFLVMIVKFKAPRGLLSTEEKEEGFSYQTLRNTVAESES